MVKKGKECIALAESIQLSTTKGSIQGIEQILETLKKSTEVLAKHAEEKDKEIETEQQKCIKELEDIQRKIGQKKLEKEQLKKHKSELESSLYGKQSTLSSMRQILSSAESDLNSAENRLSKARQDEEGRISGGAGIGPIVSTILAPGLGTLFGAAAGAGVSVIFNNLFDEEKAARNRVDDCRRRCRVAELEVQSAQSQIYNIQSQISSVSSQCASLERQQEQYNAKAKEMKEAVVFFQKAAQFWNEFQQAAETAHKNTELLQVVISKAKEKQDMKWLTYRGTSIQMLRKTFLEAWVLIETKSIESTEFTFQKIEQ